VSNWMPDVEVGRFPFLNDFSNSVGVLESPEMYL
jgi:hypothetical protein